MDQVTVQVFRYDPGADTEPYYERFSVPLDPDYTVLDALFYIQTELDPGFSFRCACRNWMCGSCGVRVNGRPRLACKTPLRDVGPHVTVEPMRNLPVIKDLVVNMDPFFAKWKAIQNAFVPKPGAGDQPEKVLPESREDIEKMLECITCGLCYSACTMVSLNPEFLGPAALTRAFVLVEDQRDGMRAERLEMVAGEAGAYGCHVHGDCQDVCPKGISPTRAIQQLKKRAVLPWRS